MNGILSPQTDLEYGVQRSGTPLRDAARFYQIITDDVREVPCESHPL